MVRCITTPKEVYPIRLTHPLDDILAGRSHVRVLRALDEVPDGLAVSAREVARRSGLTHPTASSVLSSLIGQGVVLARRAPRSDAFVLNRRHLVVERLGSLFEWERQLVRELLVFLVRVIELEAPWVSAAYLFGSAIRGDMTSASDIDLALVVSNRDHTKTEAAMERGADVVRERFGNRLNIIIGTSPIEQLRRPGRQGHRLWTRIDQEGIAVIDREKSGETKVPKRRSGRA